VPAGEGGRLLGREQAQLFEQAKARDAEEEAAHKAESSNGHLATWIVTCRPAESQPDCGIERPAGAKVPKDGCRHCLVRRGSRQQPMSLEAWRKLRTRR
jgi:hypothetical protein